MAKGGSAPKIAAKPISPVATPRQLDDEVKQRDRDKRRQKIAAVGRSGTILQQG